MINKDDEWLVFLDLYLLVILDFIYKITYYIGLYYDIIILVLIQYYAVFPSNNTHTYRLTILSVYLHDIIFFQNIKIGMFFHQ